MKTVLSIICGCIFLVASAQITAAEYFIDTDPGAGNAQAITITNGYAKGVPSKRLTVSPSM